MNYRHLYHAGNFADVFKHIVFIALINAFQKKETPFCCLDTHAGIGLYDLSSDEAQKKQEYESGIKQLFKDSFVELPKEIQQYLSIIKCVNKNNTLNNYPGSPWIAKSLLREQDKLILCELHKEDSQTLKINMGNSKNIAVHYQDAYLGMKAFLPPKEKRGLILIDPPFEVTDEFFRIEKALSLALHHFKSGCYMIWYPIKEIKTVDRFLNAIHQLASQTLHYHLTIEASSAKTALNRCGILIINPPWKIRETLEQSIFPLLEKILHGHISS